MTSIFADITTMDSGLKIAFTHAGRILVILAIAWLLRALAGRLIRMFRSYMARRAGNGNQAQRIDTLGRVFRYVANVVIALVAGTLVLDELGISVAPILATAGVAGVAVGFGAQSLIKDYFTGFFLLIEDQIRQGDVVEIAGQSGLVEEVTLRYVRMRDFEGHVHFVPNGEIKLVVNYTRDFAQSLIEVGVAYRENVDEALAVMREVGQAMRADPAWSDKMLADTEIVGVERWDNSAVALRCRFKVLPMEQWSVRREYLKRLKAEFDARGIEIPFPHITLYPGQAKDGSAPPLRVVSQAK